jgi:OOP family OmpA-OmpF porin
MLRRFALVAIGALVFASCGKDKSPAPAPSGSTTITIVSGASGLTTTAYSPSPITVAVGTTVSFLNNDSTTHTSHANAGTWVSPNIAPGTRFNTTITAAGTYVYHCDIHTGMTGTIVVQ